VPFAGISPHSVDATGGHTVKVIVILFELQLLIGPSSALAPDLWN
jgi:hypothetical protein